MNTIVIWCVVIIVAGVAEAATYAVVGVWFIPGGIAAIVSSVLGASPVLQVIIFALVSAAGVFAVRRFAAKYVTFGKVFSGADYIRGARGLITERGTVKTRGQEWTLSDDSENFPAGTTVKIIEVHGARVSVERY